jgi:hypothetical protein
LAAYFGDAGHDYGSIDKTGFSRRVYRGDDGPQVRRPESIARAEDQL